MTSFIATNFGSTIHHAYGFVHRELTFDSVNIKMDQNDPPPGYNDLLLQTGVKPGSQSPSESEKHPLMGTAGHKPSAPILPTDKRSFPGLPTLDIVFAEIPNTFNIKDGSTAASIGSVSGKAQALFPEEFCIRDIRDTLLVQGTVGKLEDQTHGFHNIVIQNANQENFLTISSGHDRIIVRHKAFDIGELTVIETSGCPTISKSCESRIYTVNQLNPNDIVISGSSSPGHICKLHFPVQTRAYPVQGVPRPIISRFNCSVVFSEGHEVSAVEKCLCLSVAIVFMAIRNAAASAKLAKEEDVYTLFGMEPWLICLLLFGGFVILLIVFVRIFY